LRRQPSNYSVSCIDAAIAQGLPGVSADGNGVSLSYMNTAAGSTIDSSEPGGDAYTGINAFGEVADQNWVAGTSTATSIDRIQYGYDPDDNVSYEQNLVNTNQSSVFAYDSLNRLTSYNRGSISVSGGTATPPPASVPTPPAGPPTRQCVWPPPHSPDTRHPPCCFDRRPCHPYSMPRGQDAKQLQPALSGDRLSRYVT
jgi:hypothetical protein